VVRSKVFVSAEEIGEAERLRDIWFLLPDDVKFAFFERFFSIETAKGQVIPLVLTDFQKRWFLDGPLFNDFTKLQSFTNRVALKCRNIGASYVMIGVESVVSAWVYPNILIPMVASQEDQAVQLISLCKKVVKNCSFGIPLEEDLKYQPSASLKFANGSKIVAFAGGNPEGIRGKRALIGYADEFAFVRKQAEVMSAMEYFFLEGGQLNILSTPWGRNNLFWRIWSDRESYKGWKRHLVSLFTDMRYFNVEEPIPFQMQSKGLVLSAPWINIDLLEKKRQQDAPFNYASFLQETCGVPMDEVSAAISEDVLNTNSMDYYYVEERPRDDPTRQFVFCLDFGAENNMTAAVVFEARDGRFIVCYTETFRGDFPSQSLRVNGLVKRFNPLFVVTDSTGMGGKNWESHLRETVVDSMIVGVNYSKKGFAEDVNVDSTNKIFMFNTMIRLLSEGLVIVPKNFRDLREEILGVEKIVYEKTVKYSGKDGLVGRDDLAMAFVQGGLVFSRIYTLDSDESSVLAEPNYTGKIDKSRTRIVKSTFIEASGSKPVGDRKERITGFGKLI